MLKRFIMKHAGTLALVISTLGLTFTGGVCRFWGHQPEKPENLQEMLRKKN